MTKNLPNIDETKRALQDIRLEIEKWMRVCNQLNKSYNDKDGFVIGHRDIESWLEKIEMIEIQLQEHLTNMGER